MRKFLCLILLGLFSLPLLAQTGHRKEMEGQTDYFGAEMYLRPLKIVGGTTAPEITLSRFPDADCDPSLIDVVCFLIPDPDIQMTKTLTDNAHIVIPGKTFKDGILVEGRNFITLYLRGDAAVPVNYNFLYNPTITIESPALPAPITANLGHYRDSRMLFPDEVAGHDQQYTRTYRLSRSLLKLGFGYSDEVIDKFFDNDITIRMNLTLRVQEVDYADGFFDLMVYGY